MAKVIIKNSQVPGKIPIVADLVTGEIAVNTADARLFTKHSDGSVKELGTGTSKGFIIATAVAMG